MKVQLKNKHSPCTMCYQRFGNSYDSGSNICQRCEYNIAIWLLKRILKCEDSCSLCSNRVSIGGGYWDCKEGKEDTCCSDDYVIDWEATLRDYLSINEFELIKQKENN